MRLTAMVTANKCAVESTLRSYEEFSDQVSRNTTAGKAQVEGLLQMAESYGVTGRAAEQAVKQALGLQGALGFSAEGAIRLTSRLQQGSAEMLGRFVPGLDKAKTELEKLTLANNRFNANWNVFLALGETASGTFERLHNSIHRVYATIGEMVADALVPLAAELETRRRLVQPAGPGRQEDDDQRRRARPGPSRPSTWPRSCWPAPPS